MTIKEKLLNKKHAFEIIQIYGTLIFLGVTVFFLLMYALGLQHVIELRFLNLLIMLAGVYFAMMQYRRLHDGQINYFRALSLGTATAFIGATTFGIFLFFFLKLEGNLMTSIQENEPIGRYLNPYIVACAVMLEGVFSGLGLSYILVNYIKTDSATIPQGGTIPVSDHIHESRKSAVARS
jgi:uncharacterized membrane protein YhaH (DUF805 family)